MSNQYKHGERVPSDVLCARLKELADYVTKGPDVVRREFTMRVPAELDRDADLVICEAARRIKALEAALSQQDAVNSYIIRDIENQGFEFVRYGAWFTDADGSNKDRYIFIRDASGKQIGCLESKMLKLAVAPPSTAQVSRDDVIQCIFATHKQSEGVMADAILSLFNQPSQPTAQEEQEREDGAIWSGWACQYPGKMPRLYGNKWFAEMNWDPENGDRLMFLSSPPEPRVRKPEHLRVLEEIKRCLVGARQDGEILDTLWVSGGVTLFDYIDHEISQPTAQEVEPVAWARQGSLTSLKKRYSDREVVNFEKSEDQHFVVPLYASPPLDGMCVVPARAALDSDIERHLRTCLSVLEDRIDDPEIESDDRAKYCAAMHQLEAMLEAASKGE